MSKVHESVDSRNASRAVCYELDASGIPAFLKRSFDGRKHRVVTARGDIGLLDRELIGFFCSIRCPGDIILTIYDLAREFRSTNTSLIGGFQSPMEKEFLDLLLRGSANVVVCPARGIDNMRVPRGWRQAISDGRLLILSPFGHSQPRATAALAAQRNDIVADIATEVLIPYAAPGGKTEALARMVASSKKRLLTLDRSSRADAW